MRQRCRKRTTPWRSPRIAPSVRSRRPFGQEATLSKPARTASFVSLAIWLLVCFAVAAIGAAASARAGPFYAELVRPGWAPPAAVFGPVWTLLYALMGISAWLVWLRRDSRYGRPAMLLFALQLILNALWSWLFFAWYQGALAFVDIVALWCTIAATLILFWRVRRLAGMLLVPYLAWVTFASVLNFSIWRLNPEILA